MKEKAEEETASREVNALRETISEGEGRGRDSVA